ncbi:MAG: hypothetical protein QXW01_00070 [Candidatus Aenigmatarchaeota archaeon]
MKRSIIRKYLKNFLYILTITVLISISTIIIHEFGHFLLGLIANCKDVKIILFGFDFMKTYTILECMKNLDKKIIGLSGSFLVLPICIIMFLWIKTPDKYLSLVMLGFNLIISTWDFEKYLGFINNELIIFLGIVLIIMGEILTVEKYVFRR